MCNIVKKVSQDIFVYLISIHIPIIDLATIVSVRKSLEADLAAEQVKLALEAIGLEE